MLAAIPGFQNEIASPPLSRREISVENIVRILRAIMAQIMAFVVLRKHLVGVHTCLLGFYRGYVVVKVGFLFFYVQVLLVNEGCAKIELSLLPLVRQPLVAGVILRDDFLKVLFLNFLVLEQPLWESANCLAFAFAHGGLSLERPQVIAVLLHLFSKRVHYFIGIRLLNQFWVGVPSVRIKLRFVAISLLLYNVL